MSKAYRKDVHRSIIKGWKRFLSIVIITALGVAMLTGLYAACLDMYYSADKFYDRQNLFDIRILSTLGLTEEDVEALSQTEGVAAAEGAYTETVRTEVDGIRKSAEMTVLSQKGLNIPHILAGKLPAGEGEIAVTQKYLEESGKSLGDTLTIEEEDIKDNDEENTASDSSEDDSSTDAKADTAADTVIDDDIAASVDTDFDVDMEIDSGEEAESPTFVNTVYTITGVVIDPMDIQSDGIAGAIRTTAATDYKFFVTAGAARHDIFTAVYISLEGTGEMDCYSEEYEAAVRTVIGNIESRIKRQREQIRYDLVLTEAQVKIKDAETTMNEKFAEADGKFADAWDDIRNARRELADGEATLNDEEKTAAEKIAEARSELDSARQKLEKAEEQLKEGEARLLEGETELKDNAQKLNEGKQQLAKERQQAEEQLLAAEQQLTEAQNRLDASRTQLEAGISQLKDTLGGAWPAGEWDALVNAAAALAVTGADDNAIAEGVSAESALLAGILKEQADTMNTALSQQISQMQAALDMANRDMAAINGQLGSSSQAAADAQADLSKKQAAADTALAAFRTETGKLNSLKEGTPEFNAQQAEADAAGKELDAANAAVTAAQKVLEDANESVKSLTGDYEAKAAEAQQLTGTIGQLSAQAVQLDTLPETGVQTAIGLGKLNGGRQSLNIQKEAFKKQKEAAMKQLADAEAELAEGEAQIEDARQTIEAGKAELEAGKTELADGKAELAEGEAKLETEVSDAESKIADAREEITEGKEELAEGEAELIKQEQEYADKKEEAEQKLAEAYSKLDDIDMTLWYVQDRTSLDSYSSLSNDLSSIEAVGRVFPVIFLLVAVLMSLTAMTRMVEEERGLIGTYKALGFSDAAIYGKYLLFAFLACLLGGLLGDIIGFIFMPKFVEIVLRVLYTLPRHYLSFDPAYGVGGVMLFLSGIVGATALACKSELARMPSALMRPKAPRAGARVFLERIPGIWNRLKFLNKVTARNLFRYKKRLFMTVGGIAGCTSLIICGFAIKDSIAVMGPKQYEQIYQYDLTAVFDDAKNDDFIRQLSEDDNIKDFINLQLGSMKLSNARGDEEKLQLMVIPDGTSIEGFLHLENPKGTLIHPDNNGIIITQNAAQILDLKPGDSVYLQDMELVQKETVISDITVNYLGNNVYLSQTLYEALFGGYSPNGVYAHLSDACTDPGAYADSLRESDSVLSAVSTSVLVEDFGFDLINAVMLLILVMAGGLAFVVLFTLSNTNISERVRELATIKVLGFYDNEVYQYVNKETLLLTATGIIIGLPIGRLLSEFLTVVLQMPSIYFAVHIEPVSYVISAAITLGFAVIVNWITNHTLNRINMVEALKSVE